MSTVGTLLPPSYIADVPGDDGIVTTPQELPAYSSSRGSESAPAHRAAAVSQPESTEFYYELKSKGKPLAVLTIIAPRSNSKTLATFLEGVPVKGRVRLSLDKPDTIQSIVVSLTAQLITGAKSQAKPLTFLDISRTLWSQSQGEPQNTRSGERNSSASGTDVATSASPDSPRFSGKLQGDYEWHFSIDLPKDVVLPLGAGGLPQVFNLPQTFNERHSRANVGYEVSVRFVRGKLRMDHIISTPFGFVPLTRPPPFPPLRLRAYQEGSALLGPSIDPESWFSADSIQVKGTIFDVRTFQVSCTLFLAKPLSYTRGSLIPLYLRLESADEQALDLLSSPKAIVFRLRRRTKYHWNADKALESSAWKDAIDYSQLAVWWPSTEGSDEGSSRVRFVNGELHIRSDVKPTSAIAHFRIEYSAVLFPFDTPGVVLAETEPLVEHPVDIVTSYAPGPRPRMFAPPGYEPDSAISAPQTGFNFIGSDFL